MSEINTKNGQNKDSWFKWLIVAIVLLALGVVLYIVKSNWDSGSTLTGKGYYDFMVQKYEKANGDKKVFVELANEFNEKVESTSNESEKYLLGFYYAKFVYLNGVSANDAKTAFRSISQKENITKEEACELKDLYLGIYGVSEIENDAPLKEQMEKCNAENN